MKQAEADMILSLRNSALQKNVAGMQIRSKRKMFTILRKHNDTRLVLPAYYGLNFHEFMLAQLILTH